MPDFNFPAFHSAAAMLRSAGYEVFSPAETDGGDTSQPYTYYLRIDIAEVIKCDAVVVLEGWENSRGARLEVAIARELGLPIFNKHLEPVSSSSILEEALKLVYGPRRKDYGHPLDVYGRIGRIWGAIIGIGDLSAETVVLMLVGLKVGREAENKKRDNRTDMAGYAECLEMIEQEKNRRAE